MALDEYSKLPKGYNFLLIYEDGKVSIWKDGKKLSVYDSDNILDEDFFGMSPAIPISRSARKRQRLP